MAKTPKQKTMAENHKVGTVLATGLFLIICLLIAFPLVCGLLGSFRNRAKVITTGMSLDLHSPVSMHRITASCLRFSIRRNACGCTSRHPESTSCGIRTVSC